MKGDVRSSDDGDDTADARLDGNAEVVDVDVNERRDADEGRIESDAGRESGTDVGDDADDNVGDHGDRRAGAAYGDGSEHGDAEVDGGGKLGDEGRENSSSDGNDGSSGDEDV